jgi:preprotein translocase subunit YajC
MGNVEILAAASTTSKGNPYLFPIIIVALFALLYFVMIRPQRNRQRQAMQVQNEIVPGQRVRTTAGMYATVVSLEDGDVVLEVAPGVNVRYMRRAILDVVPADTGMDGPDPAADGAGETHDSQAHDGTETTSEASVPGSSEDGSTTA